MTAHALAAENRVPVSMAGSEVQVLPIGRASLAFSLAENRSFGGLQRMFLCK